MTRHALSVVVPVFNSSRSLDELVRRLAIVLPEAAGSYELILIDDGSDDGSWAAIERLAAEHPWVRGVSLIGNYGQHNAVLCGIRHARHGVIVTMDDDLQNPPEELPALLGALGPDIDVVYGVPVKQAHGLWRSAASRVARLTLRLTTGRADARLVTQFRAFRTDLRNAFADYRSPLVSIDVLLTWATRRFASVPVEFRTSTRARSSYSFVKLLGLALDMLTGFSVLPLRLVTLIGFGFTLMGVGVLSLVLVRYFTSAHGVPGFPFLASIIAIFSGAQLFALGIIGEYLGRLYLRTMGKPSYVVRAIVAGAGAQDEPAAGGARP